MRFGFRLLIFILISALFSFSNAYSTGIVCCYDYSESIIIGFGGSCTNNQIELGPGKSERGSDACEDYQNKRMGCESSNGNCAALNTHGQAVFNISAVLNEIDANNTCPTRIPYDGSCIGTVDLGGSSSNQGGTSTGGGGGGNNNNNNNLEYNRVENTQNNEITQNICSNSGNPLGIFVNSRSCEQINPQGGDCLFNPYLGGIISTSFENDDKLIFNEFESSCIPRSQIKSCFDYKTQTNCESNPSIGENVLLDLGCTWVPAKDFSEDILDNKNGVCISNAKPQKNINQFEYSKRGNLILNPSFEEDGKNWVNLDSSSIAIDENAYHGKKVAVLSNGDEIKQNINYLTNDISYSFFLYAKVEDTANSSITLRIETYNRSGSLVDGSWESVVDLEDNERGIYKRINFLSYQTPNDISNLTIKIKVIGSPVYIDAVSFGPSTLETQSITGQIFKPTQIIPPSASYCGLCYDKYNLNLCTQSKSNLLGDCSYMVESPAQEYVLTGANVGYVDNFYSINSSWTSQSLANAKLFCELYTRENQCVDPNNYVNSKFTLLHPNAGNTLCKWDGTHGCFKDTDNNNLPDTYETEPILRGAKFSDGSVVEGDFGSYVYTSGTNYTTSDFKLACDTLPPQSYIYFRGYDNESQRVLITDSTSKRVGNVDFYIETSDVLLESCNPFNINNKLYVEYIVNGNSSYMSTNSNQLLSHYTMKDFFQQQDLDLHDGNNDFSFMVFDQSGNEGREWNFSLDMDVNGPEIVIDNVNGNLNYYPDVLGPDSNLSFEFRDYSNVKSCSFELTPYDSVPSEYYTSEGDFIFNASSDVSLKWRIPIFNTTQSNSDYYNLNVKCLDSFDQESEKSITLFVDFNTDLLLIAPKRFESYDLDVGYMNAPETLFGISSEYNLTSCQISFNSSQNFVNNNVVISSDYDGFSYIGYDNDVFYHNITAQLNFTSDGVKEGEITCEDSLGNSVKKELKYVYDTINPELINYTVNDSTNNGVNTVLNIGGKFYTRSADLYGSALGDVEVNFEVDATGSYLADNIDLSLASGNNAFSNIVQVTPIVILNESTSVAKVNIKDFESKEDRGANTTEPNLYIKKYNITFYDKAGNSKNFPVEYYFDNSNPAFVFGGDIDLQDSTDLYTSKTDPNIEVTFNSPKYRLFECSVEVGFAGNNFGKDFPETNSLEFKLSDLVGNFRLSDGTSAQIDMNCVDSYGVSISESFTLTQDVTPPQLNSISLSGGDLRYLRNIENLAYSPIIDSINFNLNDTNEKKTICEYKVTPITSVYSCNETLRKVEFSSDQAKRTDDLNLIEGEHNSQGNEICVRSNSFDSLQSSSINNHENLKTQLKIDAICKDAVGLKSALKSTILTINYTNNMLVNFNFEYSSDGTVGVVKSIVDFDGIVLIDENTKVQIGEISNSENDDGLFVFRSSPIDLSSLSEGDHTIIAQAKSDGILLDSLSQNLIVDNTPPTLEFSLPQVNIYSSNDTSTNKTIYGSSFELSFRGKDNTKIKSVEIFKDNYPDPIYNSSNLSEHSSQILDIDEDENYFSPTNKVFNGDIIFQNLDPQMETTFRIVTTDKHYNTVEKTIKLFYDDSFAMFIEESDTAFFDENNFGWVTNSLTPQLKLYSTQNFSSCIVSLGSESETIIASSRIEVNLKDYSIDLNSLPKQKMNLGVSCIYGNNQFFNTSYPLRYVDSLPDYTVYSEEGFILTDEPYTTNITLKSVGVYRRLNLCEYTIDSKISDEFERVDSRTFKTQLNFSEFTSGQHNFVVSCKDFFGTKGPEKKYTFVIDKNPELSINNVKLIGRANEYEEYQNTKKIYIGESDNLALSFDLNKKDVSCQYMIQKSGGILNGIARFFSNLFGTNYENISNIQDEIYTFKKTGLTFDETQENLLNIVCTKDKKSINKKYTVIFDTSSINVDISRVDN